MSIMVLGPSKKRPRAPARAIPKWVRDKIPPSWEPSGPALSPLDIRAALVGHLMEQGHDATAMEMHDRRASETNIGLFLRVVREQDVEQFFVYWPANAQRAGLDVELGALLTWLHEGRDPDIRIFVEENAGTTANGAFESLEKGQRTRYYEDLASYGCPIVEWEDMRALFTAVAIHAGSPK